MTAGRRIRFGLCLALSAIVVFLPFSNTFPGQYFRPLKIKVVADQNLSADSRWREIVDRELDRAAELLAEIIGIRLQVVEYGSWQRDPKQSYPLQVWRMIETVDRGQADAVVGFALLQHSSEQAQMRTDGMTIAYRGMLLNIYEGGSTANRWLPYVITHEMVHLFGGVHVDDGTIMSPQFEGNVDPELDPVNSRIISLTRHIDFKDKYTSLERTALEKLVGLYVTAVRQGNQDIPTFLELGTISRLLGEFKQAGDAYRRVLGIDPSLVYAWIQLAQCFLDKNRPQTATAVLEEALDNVAEKDLIHSKLAALYYNCGEYQKSYRNAVLAEYHGASIDDSLWEALRRAGVTGSR